MKHCCNMFIPLAKLYKWFELQDGKKPLVMPYIEQYGVKIRVNHCLSCGKEIRNVEIDKSELEPNVAPDVITTLNPDEVFVFGSNEAGKHSKGAAKVAHDKFNAQYGVGVGMTGNCYAIPTKDKNIKTLPLSSIQEYIEDFIKYAVHKPELKFLVTKIGCGLAGYKVSDIAPMFRNVPTNVYLPVQFIKHNNES